MSTGLDMKLAIHVGLEVVVIAGISFLFYKKTSTMTTQIEDLQKQVIILKQIIESHDVFLRDLAQGPVSQRAPKRQPSQLLSSQGIPPQTGQQPFPPQTFPQQPPQTAPQQTFPQQTLLPQQTVPQQTVGSGAYSSQQIQTEVSEGELDEILDQPSEMECEGGLCSVPQDVEFKKKAPKDTNTKDASRKKKKKKSNGG